MNWTRSAVLVAFAASVAVADARVKVDVDFDKTFNFKGARTWAWNPDAPGEVKMARTATDDPEAARRRAEPIIVDAVAAEMSKVGLQEARGEPDLVMTYFLLLSTSSTAQSMGQFLPSTPEWGLPAFTPATNTLKLMNRGSLVIDLSAKQKIVWRGIADAKIEPGGDDKKRESLLREAVRDLLKRYPR